MLVSRGMQAGRQWECHIMVYCSDADSNSASQALRDLWQVYFCIDIRQAVDAVTSVSCDCMRLSGAALVAAEVAALSTDGPIYCLPQQSTMPSAKLQFVGIPSPFDSIL